MARAWRLTSDTRGRIIVADLLVPMGLPDGEVITCEGILAREPRDG